jgi:cobalt-zinc-cadmium efflux system protein
LNSVGLLAVSVVILWQALERLVNPVPIAGSLAMAIGLAAALGNWGIARVLRPWRTHSAAIRLAYIHNLGDTYVSLLPALAGVLVMASGLSVIDAAVAAILAAWISYSTILEIRQSSDALLFPEKAECPHAEHTPV